MHAHFCSRLFIPGYSIAGVLLAQVNIPPSFLRLFVTFLSEAMNSACDIPARVRVDPTFLFPEDFFVEDLWSGVPAQWRQILDCWPADTLSVFIAPVEQTGQDSDRWVLLPSGG